MSSNLLTSYEDIPYEGKAFASTHPDVLAVAAKLRGLNPPEVAHCRVLELGCANGMNLVPMAYSLPESHCVGIDLSPRQIADGQAVVDAIGLRNIELRALSILDVDENFGEFDYILCHGVFSWVPRAVQEKILDICARHLAPNGVAYISYNTYPGWHLRGMVRELMGFHAQTFTEPQERIQQARGFLRLLAKVWEHRDPGSPYGRILKEEADELASAMDSYVFHEHLEDFNEPLYFYQFIERAAAHGLQYLWETKTSALARNLPEAELQLLDRLSDDLIRQEQYFDFLRKRDFRRTLLCRQPVSLQRPHAEGVFGCQVTSRARPVSEQPDLDSLQPESFCGPDNKTITTNRPLMKRLLSRLFTGWPAAFTVAELWDEWQSNAAQLPSNAEHEPIRSLEHLAQELLRLFLAGLIELHSHMPEFTTTVSERPVASALARYQAGRGLPITSLRHFVVEMDDIDRLVIQQLAGRHNVADLVQMLIDRFSRGELTLETPDGKPPNIEDAREMLTSVVTATLNHLMASALLIG